MSTPLPSPVPRPGTHSTDPGTPRPATPTAPGGFDSIPDPPTEHRPTDTSPLRPPVRTPNPAATGGNSSLLSFLPTFSLPSLSIPSFSLAALVPGTFVHVSESEESMKGLGRSGSARVGRGRRRKEGGEEGRGGEGREDERWSMDLRIEEGQFVRWVGCCWGLCWERGGERDHKK